MKKYNMINEDIKMCTKYPPTLFLNIFVMSKIKDIPKNEIYKNGNFVASTYDFEIPNGMNA